MEFTDKIYKVLLLEIFMEIKIVLEEQEEGGFTVLVPSLPGCVSEGETMEDALKNAREAIELYLDTDIIENEQRKVVSLKL